MKKCTKCNETKELAEFGKDRKRRDGLQGNCRSCLAQAGKKLRETRRAQGGIERSTEPKTCPSCKTEKLATEFFSDNMRSDGLASQCKDCRNERQVERTYGLTPEAHLAMRKAQDYKCAICDKHESAVPKAKLFVDHCHTSGDVRWLLCQNCNSGLGHFMDDPALLQKAAAMLNNLKKDEINLI